MALKFVSVVFCLVFLRTCLSDKSGEQYAFQRNDADHNNCLNNVEFLNIFLQMDNSPKDNQISISELRDGWHHFHFHDYKDSSFFFMEIDRNRDGHIDEADLNFLFQSFDVTSVGCLTYSQYNNAWNSFFNE